MWREKALAALHQQLETIALFDRVYELETQHDSASDRAYAARQIRRARIIAEIDRLSEDRRGAKDQGALRHPSPGVTL